MTAALVEIDGLGVFRRGEGGYEFLPSTGAKVFLAYVQEDAAFAERLYEDSEEPRVRSLAGPQEAPARPELAARHPACHRGERLLRGLPVAKGSAKERTVPSGAALCAGLRRDAAPRPGLSDSRAPGAVPGAGRESAGSFNTWTCFRIGRRGWSGWSRRPIAYGPARHPCSPAPA